MISLAITCLHIVVSNTRWLYNMTDVYKKQELVTLHNHMCSPLVSGRIRFAHLFSFLCCFIFILTCFFCSVFLLFLSLSCVLCTQRCKCLSIAHYRLLLQFSLTFMCSGSVTFLFMVLLWQLFYLFCSCI